MLEPVKKYYTLKSHPNSAEKRAEMMAEYAYNVLEMTADHPGYTCENDFDSKHMDRIKYTDCLKTLF